jgi:hypothetical protein
VSCQPFSLASSNKEQLRNNNKKGTTEPTHENNTLQDSTTIAGATAGRSTIQSLNKKRMGGGHTY